MAAPSAATGTTFALEDEDHTLANALRFLLNKNPHVSFCGYSIPHPSDNLVNLRVQTSGEISATEALRQACQSLQDMCAHIRVTFEKAWDEFEAQQPPPEPLAGREPTPGRAASAEPMTVE